MSKAYLRAAGLFLCAVLLGLSQQAAAGQLPQWELGVGLVGMSLPDYRGSDEGHSYLLPFPYIVYRLEWLKVDRTGVRSTLFKSELAGVNLSLNATPPVHSKNNSSREGMSNLRSMVEFGPSLDMHIWQSSDHRFRFDLRLPVRAAFTVESHPRQAGMIFSPRLNLDVDGIAGKPWQLGVLAGPIFSTQRNHQYFYGVTESDARPDRPAYNASGGYAGTQFLVALSRRFDKMWFGAYARYDTLHGAVFEDSPLIRSHRYVSAGFMVSWILDQSSKLVERNDY
ncbi:MAG: MipA/OmpV family protein [Nitrospirota bacterium]